MHALPAILAEIGIDTAEIARRQAFLALDAQDLAALQAIHSYLEDKREHLTEVFYTHLLQFPELRPLLGNEAKVAHLKQTQAAYFSQLTAGNYNAAYVEDRLRVGIVHQRVGLTPKWYMSAYCKYLIEVLPLIQRLYADNPAAQQQAFSAFLKIVFFDIGLALDTYFHAEQKALSQARNYTEQIVSNMPIGFIVLDAHGHVRLANNAVLQMFGLAGTSWEGNTLGGYLKVPHLDDKIAEVLSQAASFKDYSFERMQDGKPHAYLADISVAHMANDRVVLFMVQDITLRKRSEEEIHRLAFYDPLTQLPNRRLLSERLAQSMSLSARSGKFGALMFIDLDNFKTLNDTQGHDVGDLLLKEVAVRLKRHVREGDTVARLGGDEFVVGLEALSSLSQEAANFAETIAEKLRVELSNPYLLNGMEHNSSPSIGVSLYRGHLSSLDEILKQADLAMYQAKAAGRNKVCFFDPAMQAEMEFRAELEKDLRASLRQQQLQLYYQVQVDDSQNIIGAEALIRWIHPQRGMVSPGQFIPLAEEIGMILPIGDWVIEQACAQLRRWEMDPLMRDLKLSVNVSPRQLAQPYFVEHVRETIEKSGARASHLKLELTESFILHDIDEAIEKMLELRKLDVCFAMDDFGTGYSSLAYLTRLPLDQLKIDQSFVRDIAHDKNSRLMARSIINIASNFGLEVIAEGVETDAQLAFLRQYGCTRFQGYLYGKPVPLQEFEKLFQR